MSETTEDKFIANFGTMITQVGTLGAAYHPPNPVALTAAMQDNLDEILVMRTSWQQKDAREENTRNGRENLYKIVSTRASGLIDYCKSFGLQENELANLRSIARDIRGVRAAPKTSAPVAGGAPAPHFRRADFLRGHRRTFRQSGRSRRHTGRL